jgi:hypothetical protein
MDCNSYSYTAPGFGVDRPAPVAEYRNDDMSAEITTQRGYNGATVYNVWAGSYDGDLDVCESFNTVEAARALYDHIMDNYTDTPPITAELNKAIREAHWLDNIDPDVPIIKPVPARVKARCKWFMEVRFMGLYDAFKEAVREYPKPRKELNAAFMADDYRAYIPSAYIQEV